MSIWATAPYLHNNSVGLYNGDPSLAARMAAYEDGMTKLLSPERRLASLQCWSPQRIASCRTSSESCEKKCQSLQSCRVWSLTFLNIPKGTPVNLIMNLHVKDVKVVLQAYVDGVEGEPSTKFAELRSKNHALGQQKLMEKLVEVNMCPDFIEDRGHTYGRELGDLDKHAAFIEYMKTL